MRWAYIMWVGWVAAACAAPGAARTAPPPGAEPTQGPAVFEQGEGFFAAVFPTMGTEVQLLLGGVEREPAQEAVAESQRELRRLEAMMSEWRQDSPISAVNAAAGVAPVEVPAELYGLVSRSLDAARDSGGAFDPTWAGMRGLWRFGDAMDRSVPSQEAIEKARRLVDWRRVHLDPSRQTIFIEEKGMALGLGGIAKGYAVDRLAAGLRARGIENFLIRLGGDLYASGSRGGRPWSAGIQDPRAPGAVFAVIDLGSGAFSTSGDYERFFEEGGRRYHHIIDPSTGLPAAASRSVTALCPDAETAEVVTKPVFILGPEKGIPWARQRGCEVVVVDADNEVHVSEGLQGRLEWRQPSP